MKVRDRRFGSVPKTSRQAVQRISGCTLRNRLAIVRMRMKFFGIIIALISLHLMDAPLFAEEALEKVLFDAKKGNSDAQYEVAIRYLSTPGSATEKEVIKYLQKSARQNNAKAQHALAFCYANGFGFKVNFYEAIKWYRKAADQGLADAQYKYAFCCEFGLGAPRSEKTAAIWYRKAAEQGLADAQFALGVLYEDGHGIAKDYREKLKWFLSAAEQGLPSAQFRTARSFYLGQGIEQRDYIEALKWAIIADRNGSPEVTELLETLRKNSDKRMTPTDVSEAERRAQEFVKR